MPNQSDAVEKLALITISIKERDVLALLKIAEGLNMNPAELVEQIVVSWIRASEEGK